MARCRIPRSPYTPRSLEKEKQAAPWHAEILIIALQEIRRRALTLQPYETLFVRAAPGFGMLNNRFPILVSPELLKEALRPVDG